MNKALTHATGDYIVFLNAGDMLPSVDTLENISASIGEGEELPAVIYGDTDIVDDEQHFLRLSFRCREETRAEAGCGNQRVHGWSFQTKTTFTL